MQSTAILKCNDDEILPKKWSLSGVIENGHEIVGYGSTAEEAVRAFNDQKAESLALQGVADPLHATQGNKPICDKCGSDNIVFDAGAVWNPIGSLMVFDGLKGDSFCNGDCKEECTVKWIKTEPEATPETANKIPRCTECGSDNVLFDAFAAWDADNQDLVLHNTFDQAYCEGECEQECSVEWVTMAEHNSQEAE